VVGRHRRIEALGRSSDLSVRSEDGRRFPVEVDGDYLGDFDEISYGITPRGLAVVA
jgi:hypothetical protein